MSRNWRPSRRRFIGATGAVSGAALAGCLGGSASGDETIRIGVLEDRSGNFALIGKPKYQASRLAVDEINANGGIDGKQVEMMAPDPQSDGQRYQELTRRMINEENVDALWAAYASPHREAIRPIVDRNEQLYFYTTQYEGGVCDDYTFCTGATARQQIEHVVTVLLEKYDVSTIYTLAPDYNFGQLSADWVEIIGEENGATIVDEEFFPPTVSNFGSTINRVQEADPDLIMSFLTGQNHAAFFGQRAATGLDVPIGTSITMAQAYEHERLDPPALEDVHVATNFMPELSTDRADEYVQSFREAFPDAEYVNQESQNNYFTVYMYKTAVERAGTTDQAEVIETLEDGIEIAAPEGDVSLDGATHHVTHRMRIARADADHGVEFTDSEYIPEQFLNETVGCDLASESETTMYTPDQFFDV